MKKIFLLIYLISLSYLSYGANLQSMSKEQIEKTFINKTFISIATDNLNGQTINNTFSMYLDNKGKIFGKMSIKPEKEPQLDQGVYSLSKDGSMYITWQHWDNKKQLCGKFYNTQNAIIAISCDNVFHTVFMKGDIKYNNHIIN